MTMAKFTVDTTNKLFIAKSAIVSFNVKVDLYSDAKEHWITDSTAFKFDFPIRTIGGDSVGGGQFAGDLYFLRDGWKIRPDEANHTLTITGNLFLDAGEAGNLIVPTVGDFTVLVQAVRSNLVLGIETGGGTAPTEAEIWSYSERKLSSQGNIDVATSIWDDFLIDDHIGDLYSAARILRTMAAVLAGKSSKTGNVRKYRNCSDTEDQVTGTVDGLGNRIAVTHGP